MNITDIRLVEDGKVLDVVTRVIQFTEHGHHFLLRYRLGHEESRKYACLTLLRWALMDANEIPLQPATARGVMEWIK